MNGLYLQTKKRMVCILTTFFIGQAVCGGMLQASSILNVYAGEVHESKQTLLLQETHNTKQTEQTQQTEGTHDAQQTEETQETQDAQQTEGVQETQDTQQPEDMQQTQDMQQTPDSQVSAQAALEISAPAAILMEASTGTVIWEKDADTKYHPASVTKIMTLLLIFDALDAGKISLKDSVTTSEFAASMGGSQVFLEPGETQNVETMIKCIAVASANDACVAMAEHISGSVDVFVQQMNERAAGLGMTNTHFENCNGLDTDNHLTTARDIALMSRELITKYPQIHDYSTIWMENITHTTAKGTTEFGLTNTNKLIRQYQYATGLKTGSTSLAKYCVSATAKKDGIELIAVILAAPDYKVRFADATTLLNYGFGVSKVYEDEPLPEPVQVTVKAGVSEEAEVVCEKPFSYVDLTGADLTGISKEIRLPKEVNAPAKKGAAVGEAVYSLDGKEIGSVPLVFAETVKKAGFFDCLKKTLRLCGV